MGEQENNEIKILIDALKYTSNIIIDLTNKITTQEKKISISENKILALENKLNKIQKLTMENNSLLKSIDFDKLLLSNNKSNNNMIHDESDEISEYIIEKNNSQTNQINQLNQSNKQNQSNKPNQSNKLDNVLGDKNKIDKLIGTIVKRKNDLDQMINENKEKNIIIEYENTKNNKINGEQLGLDFTIKTATNKSGIDGSKSINERTNIGLNNENERDKISIAQNNDLSKANNILKQIRRRANYSRKNL
jgi:hypothetical protein